MKQYNWIVLVGSCFALAGCSSHAPKEPSDEQSASSIYVQKGIQYMDTGRLEVALQDLQHAVELDEHNSNAHNALAVLYERLERPDEAEKHYQRAIALEPNNFSTLNNFGRFLCARGSYDTAMGYFRQIISSKLYDQPWMARTNAGLCARSAGKPAEAEEHLRGALEANPTFSPALLEMAALSLDNKQFLSARAFLQRYEAESVKPTAEALWVGAQTEQALGNTDGAQDYKNKLYSGFPDSRQALLARQLPVDSPATP